LHPKKNVLGLGKLAGIMSKGETSGVKTSMGGMSPLSVSGLQGDVVRLNRSLRSNRTLHFLLTVGITMAPRRPTQSPSLVAQPSNERWIGL